MERAQKIYFRELQFVVGSIALLNSDFDAKSLE